MIKYKYMHCMYRSQRALMISLKDVCERIRVSIPGFKPVTFRSHCSTVRSSEVSPSGKLQLHVSPHRKLQSLHRPLPTKPFSPCRCPTFLPHTTVCVLQTLMPCLTHPLRYRGRSLCQPVLLRHKGSLSSERGCTNIFTEIFDEILTV